jgi:uncharacterized Zn finger protein
MIKAKETAMTECKCPECASEKITFRKRVCGSEHLLMLLCEDCGCFLGAVNDTSQLKAAIKDIRQTLKASTGL